MMYKWFVKQLPALAVVAAVAGVTAQPLQADTGLMADFPQARVEAEVPIRSPGHRVMLSPIREIRNEIRSESMARVPVEGQGRLLQIGPDTGRADARSWYRRQLEKLGAQFLFECTGRDCGRSNVWANQIFNQSTLYGRDENQDYLVAGVLDEAGSGWLALVYTVTRGNQREYVWVEELKLGEGSQVPGFSLGDGRIRGPVVVPWSGTASHRFDWDGETRRSLLEWASEPGSRIIINSFSELRQQETLEQSMARAQAAADAMAALLDRSGVPAAKQVKIIVGPAVRVGIAERRGDRIELMVVREP